MSWPVSVQQLACVLTEAGLWRALAGLWRAFSQPMAWAEHALPLLIARRCPACWTAPGAACRPQIRLWSSGIKQLLGLPAAPRRPAGRLSDAHPGCALPLPQDVLWETGVAWAQRRAAGIFRDATEVRLSVEEQQAFVLMFVLLCLLACLPACLPARGMAASHRWPVVHRLALVQGPVACSETAASSSVHQGCCMHARRTA